jgi:hypothetical protein
MGAISRVIPLARLPSNTSESIHVQQFVPEQIRATFSDHLDVTTPVHRIESQVTACNLRIHI